MNNTKYITAGVKVVLSKIMEDPDRTERTAHQQIKNNVIKDTEPAEMKMRANTVQRETRYGKFDFLLYLPKHERKIWEKEAREQKADRSALIRAYAVVGRRFLQKHNIEEISSEPETVEQLIKQNVPTESSSVKNVDDIMDSIIEDIEQILLETLADVEQIQQTGEQFYRRE